MITDRWLKLCFTFTDNSLNITVPYPNNYPISKQNLTGGLAMLSCHFQTKLDNMILDSFFVYTSPYLNNYIILPEHELTKNLAPRMLYEAIQYGIDKKMITHNATIQVEVGGGKCTAKMIEELLSSWTEDKIDKFLEYFSISMNALAYYVKSENRAITLRDKAMVICSYFQHQKLVLHYKKAYGFNEFGSKSRDASMTPMIGTVQFILDKYKQLN